MLTIIWRTIYDKKVSVLVYCLAAIAFVWMFVAMFPSFAEESAQFDQLFESYPEAFTKALGLEALSLDSIENFLAIENFSILWPIMALFLAVSFSGNALAREIETGTMELLLAKPVSRAKIFFARYIAGLLILVFFTAVSVFCVVPMAEAYDVPYNAENYLATAVLCLFFAWAVFSLAFMCSAVFSERSKVYMVMGGTLVGMYAINVLTQFKEEWANLKYASFFYYYDFNAALLDNEYKLISLTVFAAVAGIATMVGSYWFNRRDIAV